MGHVTVANDAGSVDITQASEATVVTGRKAAPTAPEKMSEDKIEADFSMVLSVLPEQPVHFILYFKKQSIFLCFRKELLECTDPLSKGY